MWIQTLDGHLIEHISQTTDSNPKIVPWVPTGWGQGSQPREILNLPSQWWFMPLESQPIEIGCRQPIRILSSLILLPRIFGCLLSCCVGVAPVFWLLRICPFGSWHDQPLKPSPCTYYCAKFSRPSLVIQWSRGVKNLWCSKKLSLKICSFHPTPWKLVQNLSTGFSVILHTHKQTDKPTNNKHCIYPSVVGESNYVDILVAIGSVAHYVVGQYYVYVADRLELRWIILTHMPNHTVVIYVLFNGQ